MFFPIHILVRHMFECKSLCFFYLLQHFSVSSPEYSFICTISIFTPDLMSSVSNASGGACWDCETRPDKVIGPIFLHLCREKIPEKYAYYYPHFQDLCRKSENYPAEFEQFLSSRDDHIREWISEHRQESESDFQPMLSARDIVESIFCSNTDTVVKPVVLFSKKGYSSSSGETAK
jgi:hypothetical protein